ncbi:MAG: O-antigen ligase family protein [Acetatifactor sp.]|nr:O-antigen ligase family protein [Acetatifactor sp.]
MSNKTVKSTKKISASVPEIAAEFFSVVLDGMISIYMFLIIAVMPFYFQEGFAHIGTDKAMFYQGTGKLAVMFTLPVLILLTIFQVIDKRQRKEKISVKLSVTDWFALLYAVALVLSYLFSDYKEQCLWGAKGWYMGLLPQLMFLYTYLLISRYWEKKDWMFYLFFPVSAVVFGLGVLNRFGIFPIDMKVQNVTFLSTIGNINWYCGYVVTVFFAGCYQFIMKKWNKKWQKWLMGVYLAVGFATLVTQGSESGMVALAVACIVLFCMAAKDGEQMVAFWQEMAILSGSCVVIGLVWKYLKWGLTYQNTYTATAFLSGIPYLCLVLTMIGCLTLWILKNRDLYFRRLFKFFGWSICISVLLCICVMIAMIVKNTITPGSIGRFSSNSFFTFSLQWGSSRGATWKAGLGCFLEQGILHKLFGVGPDGMAAYLYTDGSEPLKAMVNEVFGAVTLTNAHCEWMTILVDEGLFGVIGYVGIMISMIIRALRAGIKKDIATACGLCLLIYTVNNVLSFQQSMNLATLAVILGIGGAYLPLGKEE